MPSDPSEGRSLPDHWAREQIEAVWDVFSTKSLSYDRESMYRDEGADSEFCEMHRQALAETLTRAELVPVAERDRLRLERDGFDEQCRGFAEAARETGSELATLRAENERYASSLATVAAERDAARNENEVLREALQWTYSYTGGWSGVTGDDAGHLTTVGMHARQTLESVGSPLTSDETDAPKET